MTRRESADAFMASVERLLTACELAAHFRVCEKTPQRWVKAGLIEAIRTPGGRIRFKESDVHALLAGGQS